MRPVISGIFIVTSLMTLICVGSVVTLETTLQFILIAIKAQGS